MQILLFMQLQTNRLKLSALKASAFVPLSNGGRVTVRYRSAFIFTFFEIISNLDSDYHIFILMRIRYVIIHVQKPFSIPILILIFLAIKSTAWFPSNTAL